MGAATTEEEEKGVLKNKKTFVMIYCFARAQPKPTKEEEEENTSRAAEAAAAAFYPTCPIKVGPSALLIS